GSDSGGKDLGGRDRPLSRNSKARGAPAVAPRWWRESAPRTTAGRARRAAGGGGRTASAAIENHRAAARVATTPGPLPRPDSSDPGIAARALRESCERQGPRSGDQGHAGRAEEVTREDTSS